MQGYPDYGFIAYKPTYGKAIENNNNPSTLDAFLVVENTTDSIMEVFMLNATLITGNLNMLRFYVRTSGTVDYFYIDGCNPMYLGQFLCVNESIYLLPGDKIYCEYVTLLVVIQIVSSYGYTIHKK